MSLPCTRSPRSLPARKAYVRCGRSSRVGLAVATALVLVAGCSSAAVRPSPARTACNTSFRPGVMRRLKNVVTVMRQTYQIPAVAVAVTATRVRARPLQPGRMARP